MEGMIGEIRMFGGNFAPRTWSLCEGQLLPINSHQALFSILGTTYGGDGRTTFALPDMRGRVAMHAGNGPGLSSRALGVRSGSETNTLNLSHLATHNHNATATVDMRASSSEQDETNPNGKYPGLASGVDLYADAGSVDMAAPTANATIQNTGGQQPLNNLSPFQVVNYIICLQGVFPSRS